MGEIDTKSIEPVKSSLSLFGEKNEQRKYRSPGREESGKEKEFELMLKDVANYKVQLEAKEHDYKQALLKIASYRATVDELSQQLTNSSADRYHLTGYCRESRNQIQELELKVKQMEDLLLQAGTGSAQEQLLDAVEELKITRDELLSVKTNLAAAEESMSAAMKQVETMSLAVDMEKKKTEELLRHVTELNDTILHWKLVAVETEKENFKLLSEKDAEIQRASAAAAEAQEKLEETRNQVNGIQEMENNLLEKTLLVDFLESELNQVKELHILSEKATSDSIDNVERLKLEREAMERLNTDQSIHIESMEAEIQQLQLVFGSSKEEVNDLNLRNKMLIGEMQKAKIKMDEIRHRELEAQVEIALLKSELHKGRAKIATAEAAEARANSAKSEVYLAMQELAIEAEKAKKETQRLKQEMARADVGNGSFAFYNPQMDERMQDLDLVQIEKSNSQMEMIGYDTDAQITISSTEYKSLIEKVEKADQAALLPPEFAQDMTESGSSYELHALRKELEAAVLKIGELESVAEEAVVKVETAEKAKVAVEGQLRKWRQHQQKIRAASSASQEESAPKESNIPKFDKPAKTPAIYMPLSKVLGMKF